MFDWNDYLKLADELGKCNIKNCDEACFRSAVSRAYYAIYHKAESYAKAKDSGLLEEIKGEKRPNGRPWGSHEVVQQFFIRDSDENIKLVGASLGRIRGKRTACDYYDSLYSDPAEIYQRVIEETKKYIVLIP